MSSPGAAAPERRPGSEALLAAPSATTSPWTWVWGALLDRRRRWWSTRARRLPAPVVSVGNLHLGGSGKTPVVAALARHLRDRGAAVAILSRGYGRRTRGVRVASRGEGPEGAASEVGDEPFMLASALPGVAVVVGEDRHRAGLEALARLDPAPSVFVLDDGFSHLALARDLDLLVFPALRPWGSGRLLPFGTLREPLRSARFADAVLLSGADGGGADAGPALAQRLRPFGFAGPGFAVGVDASLDPPVSGPVVLATGVANPARVLATARALGLEVVEHLAFADHHRFPPRSLERIARALRDHDARLVVTAKDRAKIADLAAPVHELRIEAVPDASFWDWLDARLGRVA
jgi:tetraacyldisaccharide 4'-kinase